MGRQERRILVYAVLITAMLAWVAIDRFDVPPGELAGLLLYCVLVVAVTALAAALLVGLVVGVLIILRGLRRRGSS